MLPSLNRTAVVLLPREPFLAWVRAVLRDEGETDWEDDEIGEEPNVYLLPPSESAEEAIEHLADAAEVLFEAELENWTDDTARWPDALGWEKLQEWFDFEILGTVLDAAEDDLEVESAEEE